MAAYEPDRRSLPRSQRQEHEFEAAFELMQWAYEFVDGPARNSWRMAPGAIENIYILTFARATKTYQAAVLLADTGFGEQAAMLNRSLFEYAVIQWWMLLCADDDGWIIQRLKQHHDHARVLWGRALEKHEELALPELENAQPLDDNYVAKLDRVFRRHGGMWHGKSLYELVSEVEERIEERFETVLMKLYRLVNLHNNYQLHHSSYGLVRGVDWAHRDQTPIVRLGPDDVSRSASLWASIVSYGFLILATLKRLSPTHFDDFAEQLDTWTLRLRAVTRDQARGVGRNDPCPCGSGRKFKHCHADYLVDD